MHDALRRSPHGRLSHARLFPASFLLLSVAILCVLGQVADSLHVALVEHEICAEHGEWSHGDSHLSEGDVARQRNGVSISSRGAADSAHDAAHEHCSCLSDPRLFAWVTQPPRVVGFAADGGLLAARAYSVELSRADVYRLAPKTSPPS